MPCGMYSAFPPATGKRSRANALHSTQPHSTSPRARFCQSTSPCGVPGVLLWDGTARAPQHQPSSGAKRITLAGPLQRSWQPAWGLGPVGEGRWWEHWRPRVGSATYAAPRPSRASQRRGSHPRRTSRLCLTCCVRVSVSSGLPTHARGRPPAAAAATTWPP